MPIGLATERLGSVRRALPVHWPTAVALGVVLAYADGFWLTSVQEAVGAIQRVRSPFANWLLHSTLMLPVFLVAVVGALALARRRFDTAPYTPARTAAAAALVVAAATLVGVVQVTASALYDYQLQLTELQQTRSSHFHSLTPDPVGTCGAECVAQNLTFETDVRAVLYVAAVLLVTNVVAVGWIVAMRGGRVDALRRSAAATEA
ncbi:MAG: hypothetical protein QOG20_6296 [Pseudonocardiales bacterium]|jgi:hypothetical protein|nr:hypothetical protein [Pseudonocardiales bacterium]